MDGDGPSKDANFPAFPTRGETSNTSKPKSNISSYVTEEWSEQSY